MFKNKRGITLDKVFLVEAILIVVVCASIMVYIGNLYNDTSFDKRIIARDLAFLADSAQSVPGNLYYEYTSPLGKKDHSFIFSKNTAIIAEGWFAKVGYPFFYNKNMMFESFPIAFKKSFSISNFNNVLVISPEKRFGLKQPKDQFYVETPSQTYEISETKQVAEQTLECTPPKLETKFTFDIIAIDADGNSDTPKQNIAGTQVEHLITHDISKAIIEELNIILEGIIIETRPEIDTTYDTESKLLLIPPSTSFILQISTEQTQNQNNNPVYAYIPKNSELSNYLACTILQNLKKELPEVITETKILTQNQEDNLLLYANKDPTGVNTNKQNLAIKIGIGNILHDNNLLYEKETTNIIAYSIAQSIEEFQESINN
ncbi:hypothetical protein HN695_04720 [Candidatus Woesearchaeota archaeon]|jgi:hypothetical protein|nr:hypothetical protein [Candidatus Woesearchaeota archaeon]MBT5271880.1 hypothetical protein [Candidatus Woesearchaeota archaeon]MBT6041656.1 hypothetical protein [Candidatus Woesearchaeota archaeon]MBT6337368.1 hypothetical protein [Candidatus Woesearchaeota archaeon]MBT7927616.1 hypothetical protein [Candidatus Woesearchaeota archaeon]